jgi:integrase
MSKRNVNGSGNIVRRGKSWFLRFRDWRVADGKLTRVPVCQKICEVEKGYRSKKAPADVRQRADEMLVPINASKGTPQATQLVTDYAEKVYFPHIADRNRLRPSTYAGYAARWRQIKPYVEGLRLRDVEPSDVTKLLERIARSTKLNRESIRSLRNLLSNIFTHALNDKGILPKGYANPVRFAKLPNTRAGVETVALSLEELQTMLASLPEPARTVVAVAGYTGLRRGEVRGLRWEDYSEVEFDDGRKRLAVHVNQSVWNGIATEPKTKRSKGWVPVIQPLATMLQMHRLRVGGPTSGPMFASHARKAKDAATVAPTSTDLNNVLNRQILPALQRCKVCKVSRAEHTHVVVATRHVFELDKTHKLWHGWHAFRRGLATNLHRLGVDDKTVQAILRHSQIATTQNIYIKSVPADSLNAMERFAETVPATVQ